MSFNSEANSRARSIDVLTINEDPKNKKELIEILWQACEYFPRGTWESIEYLGNLNMNHDVRIATNKRIYGAFIFGKLVRKIRKLKKMFEAFEPLLGITSDPIVSVYYRFEMGTYERVVNLIHDYVSEDVGVVSLFRVKEESASRLIAHGLGHNRGLRHHMDPVDLMYIDLLNHPTLYKETFCKKCVSKLKKTV
jgi:predicted Zn-dependent protease